MRKGFSLFILGAVLLAFQSAGFTEEVAHDMQFCSQKNVDELTVNELKDCVTHFKKTISAKNGNILEMAPQTLTEMPPQTLTAMPPQTVNAMPPQTVNAMPPQTINGMAPQTITATPVFMAPQTINAMPPQTINGVNSVIEKKGMAPQTLR
ncbi:MAG: hypothetical protein U1F57_07110 [bacterium]